MSTPKNNPAALFHAPAEKEIAGVKVIVLKLPFERFADAFTLGETVNDLVNGEFSIEKLRTIAGADAPAAAALARVVAACLQVPGSVMSTEQPVQLKPEDVRAMPLVTVFEALCVVMEENADFFTQTIPNLGGSIARVGSIGSKLLNSLSERVTALTPSSASA